MSFIVFIVINKNWYTIKNGFQKALWLLWSTLNSRIGHLENSIFDVTNRSFFSGKGGKFDILYSKITSVRLSIFSILPFSIISAIIKMKSNLKKKCISSGYNLQRGGVIWNGPRIPYYYWNGDSRRLSFVGLCILSCSSY